jgi:hypothetical protein
MSEENVDFVRGLFSGVPAMDKGELLAALPQFVEYACDPEIEGIEDPSHADARTYRGHEGVIESFRRSRSRSRSVLCAPGVMGAPWEMHGKNDFPFRRFLAVPSGSYSALGSQIALRQAWLARCGTCRCRRPRPPGGRSRRSWCD